MERNQCERRGWNRNTHSSVLWLWSLNQAQNGKVRESQTYESSNVDHLVWHLYWLKKYFQLTVRKVQWPKLEPWVYKMNVLGCLLLKERAVLAGTAPRGTLFLESTQVTHAVRTHRPAPMAGMPAGSPARNRRSVMPFHVDGLAMCFFLFTLKLIFKSGLFYLIKNSTPWASFVFLCIFVPLRWL